MRIPKRPPDTHEVLKAKANQLSAAISDQNFRDLVRKCDASYWHWDLLRMNAHPPVDAELAWFMVKTERWQRYRHVPLIGSEKTGLKFNVPDRVQQELMYIDQELAGLMISSEEASPLPPHQKERFILSALREEAIASSMLEGAVTTRRDANKMLESGRKPRTRGEQMVYNNFQAIQFVRDHRTVELSPKFLLELQEILTRDTLDKADEVGRFRTERDDISIVDVRDNEVIHIPPPANELEKRIAALCRFANEEPPKGPFIHPVVRASIIHFQLGFDHPFCDGNGRTARALFYWFMLRKGYWLFEYIPISRIIYQGPSKYARAFLYCETDEFDVTYFLMYKADIIERARREFREYVRSKQQQVAKARKLFDTDRRLNHRQQETLLRAARNPDETTTIAEHQNKYGLAYGTARSDLLDLVEWGYLTQGVIGKRFEFRASRNLSEKL